MASNFPAALDNGTSLPNPASSNPPNSPSHAGLHDNENAAIIATQTKVGTGASTPVANTFLFGTGAGTSAWTQATSAQVAAAVSDETGTGALVFATTPTLVTPKVDTINENTLNNGVTVAGMNVKAGVMTAPGTAIGTNGVVAANLATTAITLGTAQITSIFSLTSAQTTATQVTGLTTTVTIPAGNRKVRISFSCVGFTTLVAGVGSIGIWDGPVVTGVQLMQFNSALVNYAVAGFVVVAPAAGSKTYNISIINSGANNTSLGAGATFPATILVEAI